MPFQSIPTERRRLADAAYDQLTSAISRGEIGPDDVLVQEKLAAEMQISRTPVREALLRLEQEGVLVASRRGSFRLYQMDRTEVRELYQARAAIEAQSARTLAAIFTPDMAAEMRALIESAEGDEAPRMANHRIHRAFVSRAGNRFLLQMFDTIWAKATASRLFTPAGVSGDHLRLVDVLETGDRDAAQKAFSAHIQDGFDFHMDGLDQGDQSQIGTTPRP